MICHSSGKERHSCKAHNVRQNGGASQEDADRGDIRAQLPITLNLEMMNRNHHGFHSENTAQQTLTHTSVSPFYSMKCDLVSLLMHLQLMYGH